MDENGNKVEDTVVPPTSDTPPKVDGGITFNYEELYADILKDIKTPEETKEVDEFSWDNVEVPISFEKIEENDPANFETNVIPAFDTSALENNQQNMDNDEEVESPQLIHAMTNNDKKEKSAFAKNLIFIAIFFGILIFVVAVIFPLMVK